MIFSVFFSLLIVFILEKYFNINKGNFLAIVFLVFFLIFTYFLFVFFKKNEAIGMTKKVEEKDTKERIKEKLEKSDQ